MRRLLNCVLVLGAAACANVQGQQAQNPSPMVEHTRAHRRLMEQSPPGRREKLDLGTLFLPAGMRAGLRTSKRPAILVFFHGGTWLPEVAAARNHLAVVSVQAGIGSAAYGQLFNDPHRFLELLRTPSPKRGFGLAASCWAAAARDVAPSARF